MLANEHVMQSKGQLKLIAQMKIMLFGALLLTTPVYSRGKEIDFSVLGADLDQLVKLQHARPEQAHDCRVHVGHWKRKGELKGFFARLVQRNRTRHYFIEKRENNVINPLLGHDQPFEMHLVRRVNREAAVDNMNDIRDSWNINSINRIQLKERNDDKYNMHIHIENYEPQRISVDDEGIVRLMNLLAYIRKENPIPFETTSRTWQAFTRRWDRVVNEQHGFLQIRMGKLLKNMEQVPDLGLFAPSAPLQEHKEPMRFDFEPGKQDEMKLDDKKSNRAKELHRGQEIMIHPKDITPRGEAEQTRLIMRGLTARRHQIATVQRIGIKTNGIYDFVEVTQEHSKGHGVVYRLENVWQCRGYGVDSRMENTLNSENCENCFSCGQARDNKPKRKFNPQAFAQLFQDNAAARGTYPGTFHANKIDMVFWLHKNKKNGDITPRWYSGQNFVEIAKQRKQRRRGYPFKFPVATVHKEIFNDRMITFQSRNAAEQDSSKSHKKYQLAFNQYDSRKNPFPRFRRGKKEREPDVCFLDCAMLALFPNIPGTDMFHNLMGTGKGNVKEVDILLKALEKELRVKAESKIGYKLLDVLMSMKGLLNAGRDISRIIIELVKEDKANYRAKEIMWEEFRNGKMTDLQKANFEHTEYLNILEKLDRMHDQKRKPLMPLTRAQNAEISDYYRRILIIKDERSHTRGKIKVPQFGGLEYDDDEDMRDWSTRNATNMVCGVCLDGPDLRLKCTYFNCGAGHAFYCNGCIGTCNEDICSICRGGNTKVVWDPETTHPHLKATDTLYQVIALFREKGGKLPSLQGGRAAITKVLKELETMPIPEK